MCFVSGKHIRTCGDISFSFNLTYYSFKSSGTYRAIALLQYNEHMVYENNASVYKNGTLLPKSIDRLFKNQTFANKCKTGSEYFFIYIYLFIYFFLLETEDDIPFSTSPSFSMSDGHLGSASLTNCSKEYYATNVVCCVHSVEIQIEI